MPWSSQFERPLSVPGGGELTSLLEARNYLQSFPIAKQSDAVWRSARLNLLLAAERGGLWVQYAKLSIMLAIIEIGVDPTISNYSRQGVPNSVRAPSVTAGNVASV